MSQRQEPNESVVPLSTLEPASVVMPGESDYELLETTDVQSLPAPPSVGVGSPAHVTAPIDAAMIARLRVSEIRSARPGDTLANRYQLEALLSEGGMGRVFRGRHLELGRTFAIKLVLDGLTGDLSLRERFFVEARLASSLSHRNIISVTDFGLDEHLGYYLVMELLAGETLRERLAQKRVNARFACDVVDQVAGAVRYMHQRHVIHCDLKPENVFLTRIEGERRQNLVKLLDFGLSWNARQVMDARLSGTPPYIPPERLLGQPPSEAGDVYALGAMLYEAIAGRLPYVGTPDDIMRQQVQGPLPPPPSQYAQEPLDERFDQLVLRALARTPSERHPSAEAFHYELRTVMNMMGMRTRPRGGTPSQEIPTSVSGGTGRFALAQRPSATLFDPARAIAEGPIPIAVITADGGLRFASRSFRELADTPVGDGEATFGGLRLVTINPELADAVGQVASTGKPLWRITLAGRVGREEPMLLLLAPALKDGKVSEIHATLTATRTG